MPSLNVKVSAAKSTTDNSINAVSDLLDLGVSEHLNEAASRPLHLMCSKVKPELKKFIEQDAQYDARPGSRRSTVRTKLQDDLLKMRQGIAMLSQQVRDGERDLAELRSHADGPVAFVSEAAKERLNARQQEYNEQLMKRFNELSQNLPTLNARLKKAIDAIEAPGRSKAQKTVFKGNVRQTWQEALEAIDGRDDFSEGCAMDFFSYQSVKFFLDEKASAGVTYFTVDEVLLHLNKPEHEKRGLTKLMMKNLPIVQIEEGKQSLFVDARICLAKPENIYYICDTNDEKKNKGGRPKGTFKMTSEHLEAMRTFIESSSTVSADGRRHNDIQHVGTSRAGLGTTWTSIHQNLADSFFTPTLKWDKKTTRRAGLAPNMKANSRKYYRGVVNAKPQSLSNDRPLKLHSAARHCHVNVRMCMEWAALFPDLVTTISADDKV